MTVKSRNTRSVARPETVLDEGARPLDAGDQFTLAHSFADLPQTLLVARENESDVDQAALESGGEIEAYLPSNPQNNPDGGTLELDGVSSIVSADVGGFTYVFVAGGVDDGISVFRLNANGTLTPVHDVTDGGTLELDGARGLSTAMVDGNTYLFAAGQVDDGVSVFRVNTNGSLTAVSDFTDDATLELDGASDTAAVRVGTSTYLFVAAQDDDGINTFRVAGDGRLTSLGQTVEGGSLELDGVRALATTIIGGTAYLIAGGGVDDGVSIFSVAANGTLTNVGNVVDSGGVNLNGVSDIAIAVINGTTFVFIAGADDNGVSVYSMNGAGALTHVDSEVDSAATLISGANSVSVTTVGGIAYLMVGGSENGFSLYRIESGANNTTLGALSFVHNAADAGALELSGTNSVHGTGVGGTTYLIGGGDTDDGVSVLGSTTTGQLFWFGHGGTTNARLAYVNNDGLNHINFVDMNGTPDLVTQFPQEVGIDTAAGFYFALVNGGNDGTGGRLIRGSLTGGPATTLITFDGVNNIIGDLDDEIVNTIFIDPINERIYLGIQDPEGDGPAETGIRQYSYNPLTGAITDLGMLVSVTSSGKPPESGFSIFNPRDFEFDITTGNIFFAELLTGGAQANGLFRLNTATPNTVVQMVIQAQFPDNGSNGYIIDVEVDASTNLVYFSTQSQSPSPGAGYQCRAQCRVVRRRKRHQRHRDPAVLRRRALILLSGRHGVRPGDPPALYRERGRLLGRRRRRQQRRRSHLRLPAERGGHHRDPGQHDRRRSGLQPGFRQHRRHAFQPGRVAERRDRDRHRRNRAGRGRRPAGGRPNHRRRRWRPSASSATVQITGGSFNSNENSFNDDDLGVGAGMTQSGLIGGTNITISWNQATGTLTLTGYDTFANYQNALNNIFFQSTGNNPTNYGLNTFRTITWTVSDGSFGTPGGQQNSAVTTVNITAVNDAPVNTVGGTLNHQRGRHRRRRFRHVDPRSRRQSGHHRHHRQLHRQHRHDRDPHRRGGRHRGGRHHRRRLGQRHDHDHRDAQPDQRDARRRQRPYLHAQRQL